MLKTWCFLLLAFFISETVHATIVTQPWSYADQKDKSVTHLGYLAYDDQISSPMPVVLIAHAWMGLTAYEKSRAIDLAKLGYVALALDLFGPEKTPKTHQEAGQIIGYFKKNRSQLIEQVELGLHSLKDFKLANLNKIAIMGYCFGGVAALEFARAGSDIKGVISIHGNLDTTNPSGAKLIKGKVLVLHGGLDPIVPEAEVSHFIEEMKEAHVDWQLHIYGNAVHSFSVPGAGLDVSTGKAYSALADARSWLNIQTFLKEIFNEK